VNKNRCWPRRRSSEEDLVKIFTVSEIRILEEEENGHPMEGHEPGGIAFSSSKIEKH